MLLKLAPSPEQSNALLETVHAFNDACNAIAEVAYAEQLANKFELQKLVYADIRKLYGFDSYKRDKSIKPAFRREGAVTYDERVMAFKGLTEVSLLTLQGRVLVPFRIGGYQQARLDSIKGQADLLYRNGIWYLAVTLDVPTPTPMRLLRPWVLTWGLSISPLTARVRRLVVLKLRRRANACTL